MHRTLYGASAITLTIGCIGSAYAATLATPCAAPAQAYEAVADKVATVATDSASLRDTPRTSDKMLESLPRGTKVMVTGMDPSKKWAHVTVHNKDGYVDIRQLGISAGQY